MNRTGISIFALGLCVHLGAQTPFTPDAIELTLRHQEGIRLDSAPLSKRNIKSESGTPNTALIMGAPEGATSVMIPPVSSYTWTNIHHYSDTALVESVYPVECLLLKPILKVKDELLRTNGGSGDDIQESTQQTTTVDI